MKLRAHWSVGFERQTAQSCSNPFDISMDPHIGEKRLQFEILPLFDSYVRMTASVTDGIPAELDRMFPRIPDEASFFVEEGVLPVRGEEKKRALVSKVLDVRKPRRLTPGSCCLANRDSVLLRDIFVDDPRLFFLRDLAAHVENVSPADVGNG
jgi:hypothetical protein